MQVMTDTMQRWQLFTWTGTHTRIDLMHSNIYLLVLAIWILVLLVVRDCLSCVSVCCRILGFRRAPLVVGRFVNLRTEIKPVATDQLLSTFLMQGETHTHTLEGCFQSHP